MSNAIILTASGLPASTEEPKTPLTENQEKEKMINELVAGGCKPDRAREIATKIYPEKECPGAPKKIGLRSP